MLRSAIKGAIKGALRLIPRLPGGHYFLQSVLEIGMNQTASVTHDSTSMRFSIPNWLCRYRAETFSTKEPETLDWIDAIPDGSVFWDVGANVGLYSVYAAKRRHCRVVAFEPSVFNLELLARNLYLNGLHTEVTIVPVPLSDRLGTSHFRMSSMQWGGALSTFGQDFGQNGQPLAKVFEYQTPGISMLDAVQRLGVPMPQYVKIDVDGIEHFILRGAAEVLRQVDSVLIEIDDDFGEQARECAKHLTDAGLFLHKKCALGAGNQYNQWWMRNLSIAAA
jgi:FkbM family methyltransferase